MKSSTKLILLKTLSYNKLNDNIQLNKRGMYGNKKF
tara:strand:+ start:58 stop:165 length:108 start_codon:yes stop_codon:yes gene_type:complete